MSYDMFGEFGESGFIINKIGAMPVSGLQFPGAHKVCAIGGFIPVIGAGFDIIDASLYGLEGDKMMQ